MCWRKIDRVSEAPGTAASGGFPDSVRVENSHIVMPELSGIGFEGKSDLFRLMRELAE